MEPMQVLNFKMILAEVFVVREIHSTHVLALKDTHNAF